MKLIIQRQRRQFKRIKDFLVPNFINKYIHLNKFF